MIFGTVDRLGLTLFTAELSAIRSLAGRGVEIDYEPHAPVNFRGL